MKNYFCPKQNKVCDYHELVDIRHCGRCPNRNIGKSAKQLYIEWRFDKKLRISTQGSK
jgi:hypothetical protein